jgi:hypothetical protein
VAIKLLRRDIDKTLNHSSSSREPPAKEGLRPPHHGNQHKHQQFNQDKMSMLRQQGPKGEGLMDETIIRGVKLRLIKPKLLLLRHMHSRLNNNRIDMHNQPPVSLLVM